MKPIVYLATDHAGFALKEAVLRFLRDELEYQVVDCGAHSLDMEDDYPDMIAVAAAKVSDNPQARAIIFGGSGQGEAIVANRFPNVRAIVFYGMPLSEQVDASGQSLDLVVSSRLHNDANVLSIGSRFVTEEMAKEAIAKWLETSFSGDERHVRRIKKIEQVVR